MDRTSEQSSNKPLSPSTGEREGTVTEPTSEIAGQARAKAEHATSTARQQAEQAAGRVKEQADLGREQVTDSLDRAADLVRRQGEGQEAQLRAVATTVADRLEQGSQYLRTHDTDQLLTEVEAQVRRRPVESVLVAAGLGFLLSKTLR